MWMAQTIQPAVSQKSRGIPDSPTTPRKKNNQNPCLSPANNHTQGRFPLIVRLRH